MNSDPNSRKHLLGKSKDAEEDKLEEEILSMMEEGHEHGVIMKDEVEMIHNIFQFRDMDVKDIMTARQKVSAIEKHTPLTEALDLMLNQGFSRYPIYEEELDHIIGIVHVRDVMKAYVHQLDAALTSFMREPFYVHSAQSAIKLLKEMQDSKNHIALVLDEYGQLDGIITMEDLLEVIVGNILDEYDIEETNILPLGSRNIYIMKGLTKLVDVADTLDIAFPDLDIETLNGFLLMKIGRLPEDNERIDITYEGYRFETINVYNRMIRQVKVSKLEK